MVKSYFLSELYKERHAVVLKEEYFNGANKAIILISKID